MAETSARWQPMHAFVRWRPLTEAELPSGEMARETKLEDNSLYSISIAHPNNRPWRSNGVFKDTYEPKTGNLNMFDAVVSEATPKVLEGAYCNFFAYGHTGSGKTHTIIGYDYENEDDLGMCLAAAKRLFDALNVHNQSETDSKLGVGFSLFELRKNIAFDLLNGRTQCHIRQGADGKTHIRGETEILEDGKVRVQPIVQHACWSFESLKDQLREGLNLRAVGSSTVHDQSSRTHAVLELEIISQPLIDARKARDDRQSELVPVGKHATDVIIGEAMRTLIKNTDGTYSPNPDLPQDEELIQSVKAEQAAFEARVDAAKELINHLLESSQGSARLGGKLVFVDLAGSEYQQDRGTLHPHLPKQTPQEKMEGRQINTDLLALKEVIRACSTNQNRIPFRSSPLTMVLRDHFLGSKSGSSAMIVTASPAKEQYLATLNSLKYGSLVGAASA